MDLNPTHRFSNRVEDYNKYRPHYPVGIVSILQKECGLNNRSVVADVGSGTGIMCELLLPHCGRLYAVEPNAPMRAVAEQQFSHTSNFVSVNGSAEATTLQETSIDLIVAAQAFHWFDRRPAAQEFKRILKPAGRVALIWNNRITTGDEFHERLETMLQASLPEYNKFNHRNVGLESIRQFFSNDNVIHLELSNSQELDWEGFRGRLLSASYVPKEGMPGHTEIMTLAENLFKQHHHSQRIVIRYVTELFIAQFALRGRKSV